MDFQSLTGSDIAVYRGDASSGTNSYHLIKTQVTHFGATQHTQPFSNVKYTVHGVECKPSKKQPIG